MKGNKKTVLLNLAQIDRSAENQMTQAERDQFIRMHVTQSKLGFDWVNQWFYVKLVGKVARFDLISKFSLKIQIIITTKISSNIFENK